MNLENCLIVCKTTELKTGFPDHSCFFQFFSEFANKPIRGFPVSLLEDTTQHGDIFRLVDPEGAAKSRSMHWSSVAIFIECHWNWATDTSKTAPM